MTFGSDTFAGAVTEFVASVRDRDGGRSERAFEQMHQTFRQAQVAELDEAAPRLAAVLGGVPPRPRAVAAVIVGACVEHGADPVASAPGVFRAVRDAFEHAAVFCERWAATGGGELPIPGRNELDDHIAGRVGFEAAVAWWTLQQWQMAALAHLGSAAVRQVVAAERELLALVERADEATDGAFKGLVYGLRVLDEEPLVVLHRETRTGYAMRMSGIGDNFQLHTLLAAALIGGLHVPGEGPSAQAVAVCRDAEGQVPTTGSFNLVAPDGSWIWNEGTPSDIPRVDGVRLLVLDPPPYRRGWPAGRYFPNMPGDLVLERVLGREETDGWFAQVADAKE
jgi:hypothetical protein